MEFKRNEGYTYQPKKEAVEENIFPNKEADTYELPTFADNKDKLPQPVWAGHDDELACYWKVWEIAFSNLCRANKETGFVSHYIDTAFNGCLFMWDSSFILMFGKYANRIFPFQKTLDNFYSHQHMDGFICREISEKTGNDQFSRYDPSATGPDLLAWCEWDYYLNFGDKERLAQVFPPLIAFHRWMAEFHTWPDGTYFSSGWGCGMDNIPRLMPGYSVGFTHGHMIWADTCMQELNNCNVLIKMAKELGKDEYVESLTEERDHLYNVINEKLWDEETGFYYDLWKNGQFNMVRHIGAFWALLAKCAPEDRAKRLIAYLEDENEFKTPHRVPTLSRANEHYRDYGAYWCGSIWAPTNYMVLKGLDQYGECKLSHEIACNHLYAVTEVFKKTGTVYENYAPEFIDEGKPYQGYPAKQDFVGWTGLSPTSILFEFVFGIKPNAAENKIVWDVRLTEKHGIEQYPFGVEGELTLLCDERADENEEPKITFKSNIPVELEIRWGDDDHKQSKIIKA